MGIGKTKGREAREREMRNRRLKGKGKVGERVGEGKRGKGVKEGRREGKGEEQGDEWEREGKRKEKEEGVKKREGGGADGKGGSMKAGENGEESYNIRKLNFTDKTTFRNTIRKPSCPLIARSGFFKLFSTPWRG